MANFIMNKEELMISYDAILDKISLLSESTQGTDRYLKRTIRSNDDKTVIAYREKLKRDTLELNQLCELADRMESALFEQMV